MEIYEHGVENDTFYGDFMVKLVTRLSGFLGSGHKVWHRPGRKIFPKFIKIFQPHQEFAKKFGTPLIF